jgi:hypothetical protein
MSEREHIPLTTELKIFIPSFPANCSAAPPFVRRWRGSGGPHRHMRTQGNGILNRARVSRYSNGPWIARLLYVLHVYDLHIAAAVVDAVRRRSFGYCRTSRLAAPRLQDGGLRVTMRAALHVLCRA